VDSLKFEDCAVIVAIGPYGPTADRGCVVSEPMPAVWCEDLEWRSGSSLAWVRETADSGVGLGAASIAIVESTPTGVVQYSMTGDVPIAVLRQAMRRTMEQEPQHPS
jgi:hypothetical protein